MHPESIHFFYIFNATIDFSPKLIKFIFHEIFYTQHHYNDVKKRNYLCKESSAKLLASYLERFESVIAAKGAAAKYLKQTKSLFHQGVLFVEC